MCNIAADACLLQRDAGFRLRFVAPTHRQWPQLVPDPKVEKVESESARSDVPPVVNSDGAGAARPAASAQGGTDATIGRFRDAVESITEPQVECAVDESTVRTIAEAVPPQVERPADLSADSSLTVEADARSAAPPKRVIAEEFVLVDSRGERRASLKLEDGAPALALSDAAGGVRAAIRLSIDGAPSVVLYDTSGRRRLEVALKPDGAAGLGLYDERGEGRAEVVVSGSGAPSVSLYGPSGKRLARVPAPPRALNSRS